MKRGCRVSGDWLGEPRQRPGTSGTLTTGVGERRHFWVWVPQAGCPGKDHQAGKSLTQDVKVLGLEVAVTMAKAGDAHERESEALRVGPSEAPVPVTARREGVPRGDVQAVREDSENRRVLGVSQQQPKAGENLAAGRLGCPPDLSSEVTACGLQPDCGSVGVNWRFKERRLSRVMKTFFFLGLGRLAHTVFI